MKRQKPIHLARERMVDAVSHHKQTGRQFKFALGAGPTICVHRALFAKYLKALLCSPSKNSSGNLASIPAAMECHCGISIERLLKI
jgi:hypothetical protein